MNPRPTTAPPITRHGTPLTPMPTILDIAQLAVQSAIRAGAEWADACVASGRSVGVIIENTSIRECEVVRDYGIGVRAYARGGVGSATTTMLDEAAARMVGEQAAAMAKATHGDPEFVCLPEPQPWEDVAGMWDDEVAGLPASRVVEWCQRGIEEARAVAPDVALSGGADLDAGEQALASSTGIAIHTRDTEVSISFMSVVARGEDVGEYFEYDVGRRMSDFEPAQVATKATAQALQFLGARHVTTARMPLVLGPMAAAGLIASTIGAATAESVQRKRSFMIGREGVQIASPLLTAWEEPFVPAGLMSSPVDGEGVPKLRRALLDRGVLTTYLHNSYTANKGKVANTAHAVREGYAPSVGIGFSNLQVARGDRTEAELIAQVSDGLYVNAGGLQPDGATGDVSATVDFGFKIEHGKLAYPVKTTMIGSDVFELLGNIRAVSSDYREEPGMIVPSLLIDGIMVVGGG
jgi:PmbA protein